MDKNINRVSISRMVGNPKYRWWNSEPKFIYKHFLLKVDKEGYVYQSDDEVEDAEIDAEVN